MEVVKAALACPRCVISVIGDHAGEDVATIFSRKIADIDRVGKTFWLLNSDKAQPHQVQQLCAEAPVFAIFISPAVKGGARPTTAQEFAKEYSDNRRQWHSFPQGLGHVTGKLDARATALVFDMLIVSKLPCFDLWEYAEFTDDARPIRFILGCSTVCAVRGEKTYHPDKLKSRFREVVAVARLAAPYSVWVR
jgi:hypothetical protein